MQNMGDVPTPGAFEFPLRVDDCIMSQGELWVTLTKLFQTVPIYDLPYPWLAEFMTFFAFYKSVFTT